MAIKIEIVGNALVCTDTVSTEIIISQPSKDVWYKEDKLQIGKIQFYDANGLKGENRISEDFPFILLSDAVDDTLTAFNEATFRNFAITNLGFDSASGSGANTLSNRIIVTQSNYQTTLGGTIDSSNEYFLDGIINMGSTSVVVPPTGINITGYSFDISGLTSTEDNYSMFVSDMSGSGNMLGRDYLISVTGLNSKVYDVKSATGDEAFEYQRINYNGCSSLGVIDNYRQGLESGTGRFGNNPSLELKGVWSGGFRITTSITRSLDNAMTEPLFKAGTGFSMSSRFLTDMNVDLGTTAPLIDFSESNFPNPSTLQLQGMIVTRNGVSNPEDTTISPNIDHTNISSSWRSNQGLKNTFVGGKLTVTGEVTTSISDTSTYYDLEATYTSTQLEHFDSPASGQLRHLGNNPREYRIFFDGILDSGSNNVLFLKVVKWDDSASSFVDVGLQTRQVNALVGSRDVAFFNYVTTFELDQNDYIKVQVRNSSGTTDVTYELGGSFIVEQR